MVVRSTGAGATLPSCAAQFQPFTGGVTLSKLLSLCASGYSSVKWGMVMVLNPVGLL